MHEATTTRRRSTSDIMANYTFGVLFVDLVAAATAQTVGGSVVSRNGVYRRTNKLCDAVH